jgi:hypothetical protein
MSDWVTISSSLATGVGTLVLAVATFSSVRSANRSARVAELSLMAGLRPVLIPSRTEDEPERVGFIDHEVLEVPGHGAAIEFANDSLYMAIALRNGGNGLAVIHSWRVDVYDRERSLERPELDDFRRQTRDLYVPAGDTGYWQGAIRDRSDPIFDQVLHALAERQRITVDILYGDHEGGQRTIARFGVLHEGDELRCEVARYWNVDRADPR